VFHWGDVSGFFRQDGGVNCLCQTWEGPGGVLDVELPIFSGRGYVNGWLKFLIGYSFSMMFHDNLNG
jgi:hypothetical protein